MQFERAFHLFALLHHTYVGLRFMFLQLEQTDNQYVLLMANRPLLFYTVWNLLLQSMYHSGCVLEAVLPDSKLLHKVWKEMRETMFQAVIFPAALVVSSIFWSIFLYDRSLIYPEFVDEIVPRYLNHMIHTNITVFVVLEILLRPHYYSKKKLNLLIVPVPTICYSTMFHWIYVSSGLWIYPLYYYMNWPQTIVISSLGTYITPYMYYFLGQKMAQIYWGVESRPEMNGKKS